MCEDTADHSRAVYPGPQLKLGGKNHQSTTKKSIYDKRTFQFLQLTVLGGLFPLDPSNLTGTLTASWALLPDMRDQPHSSYCCGSKILRKSVGCPSSMKTLYW